MKSGPGIRLRFAGVRLALVISRGKAQWTARHPVTDR